MITSEERASLELKPMQLSEIKCHNDSRTQEYILLQDKEFNHNEAQESNKDKSKRNEILHRIAINNRDAIEFQDQEDEVRPKKTKLGITNQHQTCTKIQDEEMTATWKIKMNTMDTIKK